MKKTIVAIATLAALSVCAWRVQAQRPVLDGPQWATETELVRPTDYREWVFLSSGLGMTYTDPDPQAAPRPQSFSNTFVNPSAYRVFMETGTWPDNTMFVLESRTAETVGSINKGGRFQTGLRSLEVELKDRRRFPPNGWAFFLFGAGDRAVARAEALPRTRDCYSCHAEHGAVDNTFVQFYPTLLEVARQKGKTKF